MRSFINTTLKTLFIASILPIVSIVIIALAIGPSINLRDFNNIGLMLLVFYWSIPVAYILSVIGLTTFPEGNITYVLVTLLSFTFLWVTIYWIIRKVVEISSNRAIRLSAIASIVAFEIPGVIVVALMASSYNSQYPVYFRNIYISPRPVVGQISKLYVEIASKQDVTEVGFEVDFSNRIHLVSGTTNWHGDLNANQPKIFVMEICVTQEGVWPIHLTTGSVANPIIASETIHIDSTLEYGILIRSRNYTYSQEEAALRPTPRSINVSTECSGK